MGDTFGPTRSGSTAMTSNLTCEALRDDLVSLLYEDGEATERSRARDHLALCVPCRAEYSELRAVRTTLANWDLPAPSRLPSQPARSWLPRSFPVGLAAAAGLVLGIGIAVAGRGALSPGLPPQGPEARAAGGESAGLNAGASSQFVSRNELDEILRSQENRHQSEIEEIRRTLVQASEAYPSTGATPTAVTNLSPATLERLLKASEERQAQRFESRLAGLRNESDLQRQYDMAQIAASLAYIDSRTGADAARTSELMKNLVRVTAKPQDR
jgi:hypothetical protein